MAALKNARHETFAQELAKGISQRKAYRVAFPNSQKWKDSTVDSRACDLAKNSKVLARVKEIQDLATSKAVKTVTERKEWLSQIMDDRSEKTENKLKACDMLNKMDDAYSDAEEKKARIDKLKAETARIKGDDPDGNAQDDGFIDALRSEANEIWQDE